MTGTRAGITSDELAAAVRARLGPHTDARVAAVFQHGRLHVDHDIDAWESSLGRVRAHRVRIGLPPAWLDASGDHPYVRDEVTRLLGAAVASRAGETIAEVAFFEEDATVVVPGGPYRT